MVPAVEVVAPGDTKPVERPKTVSYGFNESALHQDFQWLRTPESERLFSTVARPGHLRLTGRESMGSWFEFALVARRQEDHRFRAETVVEFSPETYQQTAGLTHYYNRYKFHALGITLHEKLGRVLVIQSCPGEYPSGKLSFPIDGGISIPDGRIHLAVEVHDNDLQFFWHTESETEWKAVGPVLDGGVVSDEGGVGEHGSFTGAFVGMFAYDITGGGKAADFDSFSYARL
jgi:xylan 1,4-beta-xylosidase